MRQMVLIAYGNPSRRDDGLAFHLVHQLREELALPPVDLLDLADGELIPGVQVVFTQQLVPEMSEILAQTDEAVFIDAHIEETGWPPIYWQEITPRFEGGMVSHHFKPETLLAWSSSLFHHAPRAFLLSVQGTDFDFGYELSPMTENYVKKAAALLLEKINQLVSA